MRPDEHDRHRLFSSSTKSRFEFGYFEDDVPVEHASLEAFFKAVNYSFARSCYAPSAARVRAEGDSFGSGYRSITGDKAMKNCGTCVNYLNSTCTNAKSMAHGIAMLADEGCSEHQAKPVAANDDAPIADAI